MFKSEIEYCGEIDLPSFSKVRVMMLPFHFHDPLGTLPDLVAPWRKTIVGLCEVMHSIDMECEGTAYLTIDEAIVPAGETHRRPGRHVDGIGPDGLTGAWGGGGGGWSKNGMLTVANTFGCRGWVGDIGGEPGPNGDCSKVDVSHAKEISFEPGVIYRCGPLSVHEAVPMKVKTWRQFVRLSMPSDAPWYEGYTRNPLGVEPDGPIHPPRTAEMSFRP